MLPVHVPELAVSRWPSRAVPEILGGSVFVGLLVTTAVAAEVALAAPAEFDAVTATRRVALASALVTV
ncbi:MAG TPA: hypothetical protein VNA28_03880 [Solirubrobacteraceae bacterium]|nr:hypothetical protein [Solirubrobacteraceae bacterium]